MAVSLTHNFVSAKTDSADATLIQPSNWNEQHTLSMDTGKLLGRSTAGTGAAEEITVGSGLSLSGGTLSTTGSGGTPGGSSGQVQFNNAGAFAGMSGTSWDDANGSLAVSGATVTSSKPIFDLAQTWNNAAVTFTGFKADFTDTASAAASELINFGVGGVSRFLVTKAGNLVLGNSYEIDGTYGFRRPSGNVAISVGVSTQFVVNTGGAVANTFRLNLANQDVLLTRVAAGVLSVKSNASAAGIMALGTRTVAALPTATAAGAGALTFVSDATATTPRSTVAGGGSNFVMVMSDGTNWLIAA